jgi:hypothetical protein
MPFYVLIYNILKTQMTAKEMMPLNSANARSRSMSGSTGILHFFLLAADNTRLRKKIKPQNGFLNQIEILTPDCQTGKSISK